ncbi:MAG: glycosyltransferase [Syntrophothermus sp.]
MGEVTEITVTPLSIQYLQELIEPEDWERLELGLGVARELLSGRRLWNVNSTAAGGGVAEMLRSWVGLARGLDVDMRWVTIPGDPAFFTLTKRLHNFLHGDPGDRGPLGVEERRVYEEASRANADAVLAMLAPGDVVFLHDPQTAGLAPRISAKGHPVVWRCHVGTDEGNEYTEMAWEFLCDSVQAADAAVFSRREYVPEVCGEMLTVIVPPSIDAMSPKNQELSPEMVREVLGYVGLIADGGTSGPGPEYTLADGTIGIIQRRCEVLSGGPLPTPETPLVTQVSRWDRLKDPVGVMRGFAEAGEADAHLVLAGPSLGSVADDPEGLAVYAEVEAEWRRLPDSIRARVHLARLPMDDLEENAIIVNALQRHSTVVVQKSLREGFGLTVTEAMWKARPVVASATGGIRDQIVNGINGLLLHDPHDVLAFASAVLELLHSPARAREIGDAARETVRKQFLENRHTLQYVDLLGRLLHPGAAAGYAHEKATGEDA